MPIFVMAAFCVHMLEATVFEQFYYLFTVHGVFIHTIRININKKNNGEIGVRVTIVSFRTNFGTPNSGDTILVRPGKVV